MAPRGRHVLARATYSFLRFDFEKDHPSSKARRPVPLSLLLQRKLRRWLPPLRRCSCSINLSFSSISILFRRNRWCPLDSSCSVLQVLVPVANGSEPIEAVVMIDVLRRAGADVTVASVEKQLRVDACHGVKIVADTLICDCRDTVFDLISLPVCSLSCLCRYLFTRINFRA